MVEIAHHAKGGPPRHLHRDQDEWFHVIEGEYIVEIGDEAGTCWGRVTSGVQVPVAYHTAGST